MPDNVILLCNLGSPDSTSVGDVRRYLREFLMDERVMDFPFWKRFAIVEGLILPFRPRATAEAYRSIWTHACGAAEGSPLVAMSRKVQALLQEKTSWRVELAMRYGRPSIEETLDRCRDARKICLIPLYPHYAMSSYETCVARVRELATIEVEVLPPFFDDPLYIDALYESARPYLEQPYDHLLFSYHGLPVRHLKKTDPTGAHCQTVPHCCEHAGAAHATCYRAQVFKTMRAFAKRAGLLKSEYSIAFQSRLGRDPWLEPFTDVEIIRLAKSGIKRLLVITPSFVTDCLETLEEIAIRGRESFLAHGGEDLTLIPCLNDHPKWIEALAAFSSNSQVSPE